MKKMRFLKITAALAVCVLAAAGCGSASSDKSSVEETSLPDGESAFEPYTRPAEPTEAAFDEKAQEKLPGEENIPESAAYKETVLTYKPDGIFSKKNVAYYDSHDNKLLEIQKLANSDKPVTHEYEYKYNSDGTVSSFDSKYDGEYNSTIEYEYDGGKPVTRKLVHNGKLVQTEKYTYDGSGKLEKKVLSYETGEPDVVTKYDYDSNGRLIKEYADNDSVRHYEYDSKGQISAEIETDSSPTVFNNMYSYGSDGKKTRVDMYRDGKCYFFELYSYEKI